MALSKPLRSLAAVLALHAGSSVPFSAAAYLRAGEAEGKPVHEVDSKGHEVSNKDDVLSAAEKAKHNRDLLTQLWWNSSSRKKHAKRTKAAEKAKEAAAKAAANE